MASQYGNRSLPVIYTSHKIIWDTANGTAVPNNLQRYNSHHRAVAQEVRCPTPIRKATVYSQPSPSGFVANTVALISGFPSSRHPPAFQYYSIGPSRAGITISNPAGGMDICLLWVLRDVR
jgi:hypothetical protein